MGGQVTLTNNSWPWSATNNDRVMTDVQFGTSSAFWVSAGVCRNYTNELLVSASSQPGMTIDVDTGAFAAGDSNLVFGVNEAKRTLTVTAANATHPRKDIVVGEIITANRLAYLKVIDGTPAATPVAPTLVQTAATYQVLLATVDVPAGATSIVSGNIEVNSDRFSIPRNSGAVRYPNVNSSLFDGNLTPSDNTLQDIAEKFDDYAPTTFTAVEKSADESVTSSIVLQNDDSLSFSAEAGGLYLVNLLLVVTLPNGIRVGFGGPSNFTYNFGSIYASQGLRVPVAGSLGLKSSSYASAAFSPIQCFIRTPNAGTVNFQWAQEVSNTNPTTVHSGSVLMYMKVN